MKRSPCVLAFVIFTVGDGDTRVVPLHALKMAARLRLIQPLGCQSFYFTTQNQGIRVAGR